MKDLATIMKNLDLTLLTKSKNFEEIEITAGYTSDLLSCVMAGAPNHGIWVTIQAHHNIIAVAALLDLNAIIITEGAIPEPATIEKANEKDMTIFSTTKNSFWVVGKLWESGVTAEG